MGKKVHKKGPSQMTFNGLEKVDEDAANRCRQKILKDNKMSNVWDEVTCVRCLKTRVDKEIK